MNELKSCHEIDEFESTPLKDEVFKNSLTKENYHKIAELDIIETPKEFKQLEEYELKLMAELGIDGLNLRKVNNEFVDLYGNRYKISNGKLLKEIVR